MTKLIPAWDEKTGKKLPNLIPEDWVGHPVLGVGITDTPPTTTPSKPAGGSSLPKTKVKTSKAGITAKTSQKED